MYEVESVLDVKLDKGTYYFLIKWKGYGAKWNSWEPEHHLEPELLKELGFHFTLSDSLIPGKIVQIAVQTPEAGQDALPTVGGSSGSVNSVAGSRSLVAQGKRNMALIKWCNHAALTWVDYEVACHRFPDLVVDYYESMLVFDT